MSADPATGDGPGAIGTLAADDALDAIVVGVGNDCCGDDSFGPAVAEALAAEIAGRADAGRVVVRRVVQLVPELAAEVARSRLLVVIDVAVDEPAGRVVRRVLHAPGAGGTPGGHAFAPEQLLALAELAYGRRPPAVLVTAGADASRMAFGTSLGPCLAALVPAAVAEVLDLLADAGVGGGA